MPTKKSPLTLEQAKALKPGDEIYSYYDHYSPGKKKGALLEPHRIKITSVKTWKRSPDKILLGCKFGFKSSGCFRVTEFWLTDYTTDHDDAVKFLNRLKEELDT